MLSDKLLKDVIVQWDEHDQFRDFEGRGEPVEVSLARDLLALRAKLKSLAEEMEQKAISAPWCYDSSGQDFSYFEPEEVKAFAARIRKLLEECQ
jgi:hypothetical protein